ncbi:MAG: DUF58 domain-containing protein [Acidimicrobiales bacterium]
MSWPIPTRRAAIVAVLAGASALVLPVAFSSDSWAGYLVLINLVLAVVLVIDVLLAASPKRFEVERVHPNAVTIGSQGSIGWDVSQRGGRRTAVWVADEFAPSLGAETRRARIDVPSNGVGSARIWFVPARRGRFEPSRVVVRTTGPLGLMVRQRNVDVPTTLRVLPLYRSAKQAELATKQARLQQIGLRSARIRGGGTEFDHLREMTADDETRRIDWAATARSMRPVVRSYRAEQNQSVLCLLDSGRVMAGRINAIPRFEYGMDAAMLLADLTTGLGDRMGLIAFDRTVHTTIEPSNRRAQRALVAERLFDIEPALAESDYRSMVTHVAARYRRRHMLVLLTELSEEVVESFVLPALPILTRTHLVAVASVQDPDVIAWAHSGRADTEGAFLRASAIEAIAARQRVAAQLRAKGALVVDEGPDRFSAALGELYLEAKAIGRL